MLKHTCPCSLYSAKLGSMEGWNTADLLFWPMMGISVLVSWRWLWALKIKLLPFQSLTHILLMNVDGMNITCQALFQEWVAETRMAFSPSESVQHPLWCQWAKLEEAQPLDWDRCGFKAMFGHFLPVCFCQVPSSFLIDIPWLFQDH